MSYTIKYIITHTYFLIHSYTSISVLENLKFNTIVRLQLHTVHNEFNYSESFSYSDLVQPPTGQEVVIAR